jgi:hypothetical protein
VPPKLLTFAVALYLDEQTITQHQDNAKLFKMAVAQENIPCHWSLYSELLVFPELAGAVQCGFEDLEDLANLRNRVSFLV